MNKFDFVFYNTAKFFVNRIMRILFKIKIVNNDVIPEKGGVLIVGNHSSWLDTLFLTCAVKRPLWFLTGEFVFNVPVLGEVVKHLCTIPVKKNKGKVGIELTVEKLKQGEVVCVFPEGQLTSDGELQKFKKGVSVIQRESDVKIIPFYITGAFDIWGKNKKLPKLFKSATVNFGEPFIPQNSEDKEISDEIRNKVLELAK